MFTIFKFFLIVAFLFNFAYVSNVFATIINAAGYSQADVQNAINSANDGDTVVIPAGNVTWSSGVSIPNTKGITLQGGGIDTTVITDGIGGGGILINVTGANGKPFRLTGFTLKNHIGSQGVINIGGSCQNFRVDHIEMENLGGRGINISGDSYGVIDHCDFNGTNGQNCVLISPANPGTDQWNTPLSLGSVNAVYVEDCTFTFTAMEPGNTSVDCRGGARFVFRYNTSDNILLGNHGTCITTYRSGLSMEVYNNTFHTDNAVYTAVGQIAGGTGVLFSNRCSGPFNSFSKVTDYRTCDGVGVNCAPWSRCDGNDPVDGNTPGMQGYPCLDQIGRAPDADGNGMQDLEPFYEWDNFIDYDDNGSYERNGNIVLADHGCSIPGESDHIQENRDYYNDTQRSGYVSYTYPHPLVPPLQEIYAPENLRVID